MAHQWIIELTVFTRTNTNTHTHNDTHNFLTLSNKIKSELSAIQSSTTVSEILSSASENLCNIYYNNDWHIHSLTYTHTHWHTDTHTHTHIGTWHTHTHTHTQGYTLQLGVVVTDSCTLWAVTEHWRSALVVMSSRATTLNCGECVVHTHQFLNSMPRHWPRSFQVAVSFLNKMRNVSGC